jgi:hypothetical protein
VAALEAALVLLAQQVDQAGARGLPTPILAGPAFQGREIEVVRVLAGLQLVLAEEEEPALLVSPARQLNQETVAPAFSPAFPALRFTTQVVAVVAAMVPFLSVLAG